MFGRLAKRTLLIISGAFHKCLGQIDRYLVNSGVMIVGVGPGRRGFGGGSEGGEEVAIGGGEGGWDH